MWQAATLLLLCWYHSFRFNPLAVTCHMRAAGASCTWAGWLVSTQLLLPEGNSVLFVLSFLLSTAGACSAAAALLVNKLSAARLCVGRAGPLLLIIFALITWHYSVMLVDAYRYPTIDGPTRNYTYIEAVDRYLGAKPRPFTRAPT